LPSQDSPELEAVAGLISEAAACGAGLTSHLLAFARGHRSRAPSTSTRCLSITPMRCCWRSPVARPIWRT
jgi:hypothetical protein